MTYHLGYLILSEVAKEKAAAVCADGNEALEGKSLCTIWSG